jgi:hypothetical protein
MWEVYDSQRHLQIIRLVALNEAIGFERVLLFFDSRDQQANGR